jgi:3-hydroxybutyryl-CoA dehydrogenase
MNQEPLDLVVVGAGTMGAGIAQIALMQGLRVALFDALQDALPQARQRILQGIRRMVENDRLSADQLEPMLDRLVLAKSPADFRHAPFVIEAAPEDLALKRALFTELDAECDPEAILATNTSSLSVTRVAAATTRPERVAGMHFFNPPMVMALVEVVGGRLTKPAAIEAVAAMARRLGKTPVIAKDTPGFIVNRVGRHFYGEALRIMAEGIEPKQIDTVLREAAGFRMGPFQLMDLIGIDVNLTVTRSICDAFQGDPRYRPHPIQESMVDADLLGRKTGRGFYEYDDAPR